MKKSNEEIIHEMTMAILGLVFYFLAFYILIIPVTVGWPLAMLLRVSRITSKRLSKVKKWSKVLLYHFTLGGIGYLVFELLFRIVDTNFGQEALSVLNISLEHLKENKYLIAFGLLAAGLIVGWAGQYFAHKLPNLLKEFRSFDEWVNNRFGVYTSSNAVELLNSIGDKGVLIGQTESGEDLNLQWNDLNHHVHVLGQSGAGKTVLIRNIYADRILKNEGIIFFDLKGDIDVKNEFKRLTEMTNRKLNIVNISNPLESLGINPFKRGGISENKDKIINALEWSESYYKKLSEEALNILIMAMYAQRGDNQVKKDLWLLYKLLSDPKASIGLSKSILDEEIKSDLLDFSRRLKTRKYYEAMSGLRSDLGALLKSETGDFFKKDVELDLLKIIQNGEVLLIQLDTQKYPVQGLRIAKMLLSELRGCSGEFAGSMSRALRPKCTVIIDEFADIVDNIDSARLFKGFLNRARGSGIGVVVSHQSFGDFSDPGIKAIVLDNTETLFSFVQKNTKTAEELAGIGCTEFNEKHTDQVERGFWGDKKTGRSSKREVQEFIFHPNDFKSLNTGEAIYIAKKPNRGHRVKINMLEI